MAELADAHGSGPCGVTPMQVQLLFPAPILISNLWVAYFFVLINQAAYYNSDNRSERLGDDLTMKKNQFISPSEYEEQRCVLSGFDGSRPEDISFIPQDRIIRKLDEYVSRNDFPSSEKHLLYWLQEARAGRDLRGELMLQNELMGLYRKAGYGDKAKEHASSAISLLSKLHMEDSVTSGTTYVNAGTVSEAFGDSERALDFFRNARTVYEKYLQHDDPKLGSLYNNMAVSLCSVGSFEEARTMFGKALEIMGKNGAGQLERAMTYLNLCTTVEHESGLEASEKTIELYVEQAMTLLNDPELPRNGYYAFVCEKCAPAMDYYGFFLYAEALLKRAKEIYERP